MEYYRIEISYQNRRPHGIFRWTYRLQEKISYLTNFYYDEFERTDDDRYLTLSDECAQDTDWLEEVMNDLENCLEVPPVVVCMEGKCAYTKHGYEHYVESLEDYRYIAGKYGYNVEIKQVYPEKILYQDEMQIVFQ